MIIVSALVTVLSLLFQYQHVLIPPKPTTCIEIPMRRDSTAIRIDSLAILEQNQIDENPSN